MKRWFAALAAVTVAVVTMAVMTPAPNAYAADDSAFQITKSVNGSQTSFKPGDTFQYTITVSCSSPTTGGCINAAITDDLPEPLVLNPNASPQVTATLSPSGPVDVSYSGTTGFTVTPKENWTYNGTVETGLVAGHQLIITVSAQVPTDVPGTYNGSTITNTATADADNAPAKNASADVTLDVPVTLAAGVTKNASVSTIPAVPGKAVDWTLAPSNESNQNVDTIVLQDPVDIANPPTNLNYLDFTGADVTPPQTTTSTDVEYLVNGAWTTTAPTPPDAADGMRWTFHGDYAPGASGKVVVHTVTNDEVTTIPDGQNVSIRNDASAIAQKNGDSSDPATDSATVTLSANAPDVAITKSFDDNTLISGQSATADIKATVGAEDVESLTINEPSGGQPGFREQGLTFTGFGSAIVIPGGATRQITVGTPVVYDHLPVGAECDITEPDNSGADHVIITHNHVAVGDDTTAHVVVNNVYTVGGFTVTKKVKSAAADQNGDPIAYDQKYTFHASCTYNGDEMITNGANFRISDGESKSFSDLPTGSDCTVTEIGTGGAKTTTVVLTQQGKPQVSANSAVSFRIGTGGAAVTTATFTNRMPVGSLQIQKVVTGDGAKLWGAGPFTMHVECVLVGANPNVVYDGDVVVGGDHPLTATIANLPSGAKCAVTETDAGGAQASAISPKVVVVGDGTTVDVTATNTFTVGTITVSKQLSGAGASDHENDTFRISLMCVYQSEQIEIPGGDERALTVAAPVSYSGLPVGADCTVTETDNGGAAGVSMTPASPDNTQMADVVVGDATDVKVVVTNVFDAQGGILPVTGGDATIWLIAGGIGLVLIGGGAVLLITRRRRRT